MPTEIFPVQTRDVDITRSIFVNVGDKVPCDQLVNSSILKAKEAISTEEFRYQTGNSVIKTKCLDKHNKFDNQLVKSLLTKSTSCRKSCKSILIPTSLFQDVNGLLTTCAFFAACSCFCYDLSSFLFYSRFPSSSRQASN